jgi:2'-5' RNA ligase
MKRMFFALWPDQNTRKQCCEVIAKISETEMRPVAADNLHVTLLFLGNISSEQEQAMIDTASLLKMPELMLTFDQISYWRKPAVLCLTASHFDQKITAVSQELALMAKQNLIEIDERPFQPHVTLARKVKCAIRLEFTAINWQARDFCLVESCSLAKGVEYRVIKRWQSKPPAFV